MRDLALSTCVIKSFQGVPEHLISMKSFWQHSIGSGIAARTLAIYMREENPELLYIAGMLHEVGRLVLYSNFPEEAAKVSERYKNGGELLAKVEEDVFGCDHGRVGAALLEAWDLHPLQIEVARFHHYPAKAEKFPVETAMVHVADIIAHSLRLGGSGESCIPPLQSKSWDCMKIPLDILPSIFEQTQKQFNETASMLTGV